MNLFLRIILIGIIWQFTFSQAQPQIEVELILTNLLENRVVKLGIDPIATDAIDPQLGEEALPPLPPGIEVRFVLPSNGFNGIESYKDYRQGTAPFTGQVEHRLKFQRGQGDSLRVLFDLPPQITIGVQDLFGGIIVNTVFTGNGSYTIPNPDALGQLKLIVNYNNAVSDVKIESEFIPNKLVLEQNYPNPFNPETKIKFSIKELSNVNLRVCDILGKEVIVLVNQDLQQGSYSVNFNASKLSSGVYIFQLNAGGNIISKKMILQK